MGRQKTISDDDMLGIARRVFRERGHTATTREIALAAGISEAILYQRFGSKDQLFFAAMRPRGPDIELLLGPEEPRETGRVYLRKVVTRLGEHFAEVIPMALRVMMHPSFDRASLGRIAPGGPPALQESLARRLKSLEGRGEVHLLNAAVTARLLLSLAHDWALKSAHGGKKDIHDLREMVDVVWEGLRAREK